MYHVGSTKRSRDSAELIFYGIMICCQQKPLEAVTVTEIQRLTGVARTTFYRSFDTIGDVIEWKCDQYYQDFLALIPASHSGTRDMQKLTHQAMEYMDQHPELPLFLSMQGRLEMLLARYQDLIPYFEDEKSPPSVYSVMLAWSVPILTTLCKMQNQFHETPSQIQTVLRRDGFRLA